jgi:predicted XRE-type DNA-binding protein
MKKYESVWDALEANSAAAESMKARARLMIGVQKAVTRWALPQAVAAKRLGISQPRLNDLLRGKISKFSLDALFDLASAAGLRVSVAVKAAA